MSALGVELPRRPAGRPCGWPASLNWLIENLRWDIRTPERQPRWPAQPGVRCGGVAMPIGALAKTVAARRPVWPAGAVHRKASGRCSCSRRHHRHHRRFALRPGPRAVGPAQRRFRLRGVRPRASGRPPPGRPAACACAWAWSTWARSVKFGQVLSTRRDLPRGTPADELARLRDRVPPIPGGADIAGGGKSLRPRPGGDSLAPSTASGGQRLHRPGALRHAERTAARGRRQGAAARHAGLHRRRSGADALRGRSGSNACSSDGRRLKPARWWPSSTCTCTTSSTWCARPPTPPAAPQHGGPGPGAGARDDLGPVHARP